VGGELAGHGQVPGLILGAAGEPINSEAGARAVSPPHCPCGHR
jgi:hypothetical protein